MNLGVNIDHIATIRQARMTNEPEPVYAALIAQEAFADGITTHLRKDRRHIQDEDLYLIKKTIKIKLNLEMSVDEEIVGIALNVKPEQATIVPENRKELTTEGGLNVIREFSKIETTVNRLQKKDIFVSLFVDPEINQIDASKKSGAQAIEIHTGNYANAKTQTEIAKELHRIEEAAIYAKSLGLDVYAGHGLTYENVKPVAAIKEITELNIGHSIIAKSVFTGLKEAIRLMRQLIQEVKWK